MAQSHTLFIGHDGRITGGKRRDAKGRPEVPLASDGRLSVSVDFTDWLGETEALAARWDVLSGSVEILSSSVATSKDKATAVLLGNRSGFSTIRVVMRNTENHINGWVFNTYPTDADLYLPSDAELPSDYAIYFLLADGVSFGDLSPDFTVDPFEISILTAAGASGVIYFTTSGISITLADSSAGTIELQV